MSMIDPEKLAAIKVGMKVSDVDPLKTMPERELRKLRSEIDRLLPKSSLEGLNLEEELVEQFHTVKRLQDDVLMDSGVPPNQRAQVAGQVASTLQKLIDCQIDMKRDERLKKIEGALLDAIATLPDAAKDAFFVEYAKIAEARGATT